MYISTGKRRQDEGKDRQEARPREIGSFVVTKGDVL